MKKNYLGRLTALAVGTAMGFGVGYVSFHNSSEDCRIKSSEQLESVIQQYETVPTTEGLAQPQDLSLQYVVNADKNFKGLVFTDTASGKGGVVTKSEFLGNRHFNFEYTDISKIFEEKTAEVPAIPEIKVYKGGE